MEVSRKACTRGRGRFSSASERRDQRMRGGGEVTNSPAAARRAYLKSFVRRRGTVGWGICADLHVALDDTRQLGPVSGIKSDRMGPSAEDHR